MKTKIRVFILKNWLVIALILIVAVLGYTQGKSKYKENQTLKIQQSYNLGVQNTVNQIIELTSTCKPVPIGFETQIQIADLSCLGNETPIIEPTPEPTE